MYEYLNGVITVIDPNFIVVEVGGVGYRVIVANPYSFPLNDLERVYVQQIVRQDDLTLYGFLSADEKLLFQKLLQVSGIGPKSALAILANEDHTGLVNAIAGGDVNFLVKFPGVGKKTAQQMVLDLQNKLCELPFNGTDLVVEPTKPMSDNPALEDALEALQALGYGSKDVIRIGKTLADMPGQDTAAYVSAGLKLLM
ncbi:MAG: Holliday junction branch migration protein RuvA [Lactobacillaceae bacterium]|jgi:Holliday junction DNA helicase RuvA|nr:Holliday junction branch migration protein RuvA [Lactobacillaceae bacterium]